MVGKTQVFDQGATFTNGSCAETFLWKCLGKVNRNIELECEGKTVPVTPFKGHVSLDRG